MKLSFTFACEDLCTRAKKAILCILHNMYKFQNDSCDVFMKLFDAQVKPIVLYGAEVWGLSKGPEIEKIQLYALKRFLHVDKRTPNDIIYGETGRYPIYINAYLQCLKFWLKLLCMNESRLPRKAYKVLYVLDERGKITWATSIKTFLSCHGFREVWENQGVGNVNVFLRSCKQRLIDSRWQDWNSHLYSSDRFSLYRLFKTNVKIEPYFNLELNKFAKNALLRIRCGMSSLAVHRRRYLKNNDSDLLCRLCHAACEDELHFVLCCQCLLDLREEYIAKKFYRYPCTFRFVLLLSTSNKNVLKNLALYLYFSFKRLNMAS